MPPLPGPLPIGMRPVEIVAAVQRLAQLQEVALAAQADAELVAHSARAAVAARDRRRARLRPDRRRCETRAVTSARVTARATGIRSRSAPSRPAGLRHGLEQGLQGVLENELIRLERHRAVGAGVDLALGFGLPTDTAGAATAAGSSPGSRRRPSAHCGPARARIFPGEDPCAGRFHRAGVAALHLGKELRRFLALDQSTAHALLAEIDGERQSDRPGARRSRPRYPLPCRYYLCGERRRPDPGAGRPQDRRRKRRERDSPDGGPRLHRALLRWAGREAICPSAKPPPPPFSR